MNEERKARRIANVEEIIDIMTSIKGGQFVTFGYVSDAKVYKKRSSVSDEDLDVLGNNLDTIKGTFGNEDAMRNHGYYSKLSTFHSGKDENGKDVKKLPFAGLIKLTTSQINFISEKSFRQKEAEYLTKRDEINKKYGVYKAPEERRGKATTELQDYGNGGIAVGNTDNTRDKVYMHTNGATRKSIGEPIYYFVDDNGNLISEPVSKNLAISIIAKSTKTKPVEAANDVLKLTQDENIVKQYVKEIEDLNFKILKYDYDKIIFISCTYNGEKIFYINDKMSGNISKGLTVAPETFEQIAYDGLERANKYLKEEAMINDKLDTIEESVKKIASVIL